jgi:hypothetical protein
MSAERGQCADSVRTARGHHSVAQPPRVVLNSVTEVKLRHGLHLDHPHDSSYKPQH